MSQQPPSAFRIHNTCVQLATVTCMSHPISGAHFDLYVSAWFVMSFVACAGSKERTRHGWELRDPRMPRPPLRQQVPLPRHHRHRKRFPRLPRRQRTSRRLHCRHRLCRPLKASAPLRRPQMRKTAAVKAREERRGRWRPCSSKRPPQRCNLAWEGCPAGRLGSLTDREGSPCSSGCRGGGPGQGSRAGQQRGFWVWVPERARRPRNMWWLALDLILMMMIDMSSSIQKG